MKPDSFVEYLFFSVYISDVINQYTTIDSLIKLIEKEHNIMLQIAEEEKDLLIRLITD